MAALDVSRPVGVVGAGTMGTGIARVAAAAGHETRLLDAVAGRAAAAAGAAAAGSGSPAGRLVAVDAVDELAGCALVVEAVVEDLAAKRDLLGRLAAACGPATLLATNTSSLSVTAVAAGVDRPERVLGLHFFNPAPVLPLVEVVRGAHTGEDHARTAEDTVRAWGKTPIRCADVPGFVVNRVSRPFYGEGMRLLEQRATDPATLDAVLREAGGFRMGPCQLSDLIGQDVNHAVSTSVWDRTFHDPRYQPSPVQQQLVDAGWLGRKTGRGFHAYGPGGAVAAPAAEPERPRPAAVSVTGGLHVLAGLVDRLARAGVDIEAPEGDGTRVPGIRLPAGGWLVETSGQTASGMTARLGAGPVLALDWALDAERAGRFALAAPERCPPAVLDAAVGLLQATGAAVSVVDDVPGLVVARTVAMLANEAIDLVHRGEASPQDVDAAMRLGTAYPFGPYAWGAAHAGQVLAVLAALHEACPTGRYRPSPRLHRLALAGSHADEWAP